MIPYGQIDRRSVDNLRQYLVQELRQAIGERAPIEAIWKRWLRAYKQQPEKEIKTFPFRNCANLVTPIIATDVDTVSARILGMLFAPENLWSTKPLRPETIAFSKRLQEFLEWAQHHDIPRVYEEISDWVMEICKLGTGVLKTRYEREMQEVYEWRETAPGQFYEAERRIWLKDHPTIKRVALYDALWPSSANEIQPAAWFAERIDLTWAQLVQRVNQGLYTGLPFASFRTDLGPLQGLRDWWATNRGSSMEQFKQKLDRVTPGYGDRFPVHEVWLDFDIKNNSSRRALVCTIHLESESYLRLDWNPFFNQEKPYDLARYLRQEGRMLGIGLCEQQFGTQEEVSTMHNQRIDNGTVINMALFKTLKGSGIRQDEPLWPGRILELNSMDDLQPVFLGNKADSTVQAESLVVNYAQRRTGVSDYVTGENDPSIGYAALGTNVMQQREGAKRFDQTLRDIRAALSSSGQRIVELYQQFSQGQKPFMALGPEDGAIVQQVLTFPTDLLRMSVAVDVTATSASFSKEADIRTNTILLQMQNQFSQQLFQAMMTYLNPQLPEPLRNLLLQMMESGLILFRRLVDDYGVQDADRIVPDLGKALNANAQILGQLGGGIGQPGSTAGFPPGPAAVAGPPQMGGSPPGAFGIPGVLAGAGGVPTAGLPTNGNGNGTRGIPFAG